MKTFLYGLTVTVFSATSILAPLSSASARSIFREQVIQQQQEAELQQQDAQEVLQLLGISLEETDPVLRTNEFTTLVESYQAFKGSIGEMGALFVDFFDTMIELMLIANEVNHPAFEDLRVSEDDIAELMQARDAFVSEYGNFEEDFTQLIIEEMLHEVTYYDDYYYEDDYYYDDTSLWAYGYADPWTAQPGQIVWLRNDSSNPAGTELTTTWRQIGGPEVTWLTTSHETDALFIAPQLPAGEEFMSLQFELMVDNGDEVDFATVWVDIATEEYWEYDEFDFMDEDFMPAAVDLLDPKVGEVLDLLDLDLPENDPLFSNPQFENFVNTYKNLSETGDQIINSLVNLFEHAIDIYVAASQIDHEQFQAMYAISEAELQEVDALKQSVREELSTETIDIEDLFLLLVLFSGESNYAHPQDSVRISQVKQIQTALELYYADHGQYPVEPTQIILGQSGKDLLSSEGFVDFDADIEEAYMWFVPSDPDVRYDYTYQSLNGSTYTITFNLEQEISGLAPGLHEATPNGIQ